MKILSLRKHKGGSTFHRLFLPLSKLNAHFTDTLTEELVSRYDSLWFHYKCDIHPTQLSLWRLKYGTQIVLDIDDTWNIPRDHPSYKDVIKSAEFSKQFAIIADWVVCSTPDVEEMVKPYNPNTIVIPNRIPYGEGQYHVRQESLESFMNRKIRIGFCGSISHMPDWMSIHGKLKRVWTDAEVKQKCEFVLCGVPDVDRMKPDWLGNKTTQVMTERKYPESMRGKVEEAILKQFRQQNKDNWNKISGSIKPIIYYSRPVEDYIDLYREIDILLCPLVDNHLNKCKCIEGDSLVVTTTGIKKIKDIVDEKQKVTTLEKKQVVNYFKYEESPTIKITTVSGYTIEGTYHHKILVDDKWIQLKELKVGNKIDISPFEITQSEYQYISYPMLLTKKIDEQKQKDACEDMIPKIKINENWGRLLGYMVGDGHFGRQGFTISCDKRHTNVVDDVDYLFKSIGLYPRHILKQPDKRCQTSQIKEGNGLDIKASSRTLRKIAEKYNWVTDKGKTFEIPKVILESPKSVIKEFIKGLFEADAGVTSSGILFCSKSETLIKQLQVVLLGFNIKVKVKKQFNKQYRKYYWYIHMGREAADIYYSEIGFVSKHKQDSLKFICVKQHGGAFKKYDWKEEIIDIEYRTNTVYDIEVEDTHQYNGNGIINHNSSLKILEAACTDTYCILGKPYQTKELGDLYPVENWYENIKSLIKDKEKLFKLKTETSAYVRGLYNYYQDCVLSRETILGKKRVLDPSIYGITYKDDQQTEYKEYRNFVNSIEQKSYLFELNPIISLYQYQQHE